MSRLEDEPELAAVILQGFHGNLLKVAADLYNAYGIKLLATKYGWDDKEEGPHMMMDVAIPESLMEKLEDEDLAVMLDSEGIFSMIETEGEPDA